MVILSIVRTVGIYLGLIQADTNDLCVACAYDLAHKDSVFCGQCDEFASNAGLVLCKVCGEECSKEHHPSNY